MARVTFLSIADRNAQGIRLMSASLRKHGHECHVIFLKRYPFNIRRAPLPEADPFAWIGIDHRGRPFPYAVPTPITARERVLLRELLSRIEPDVIGMTVTTPLRRRNAEVARYTRSFSGAPVIWGGFDPTFNTRDCLEFCDYACIGEGDTAILEIANAIDGKRSLDNVPNLARLCNGSVVANRRAPLEANLDSLPWRDNTPEYKYFIEDDSLVESYPVLNDRPPGTYQTTASRGCPYRCTYCCEAPFQDLYAGERFLRRRSARDCVAELAEVKKRNGIRRVLFEDEIFAMHLKWLEEFSAFYREQVGLPFEAYIFPTRNAGKLLPVLKNAGLATCAVSLQSGSSHINKNVFGRVFDRELFLHTVRLCKTLGIPFYTDVITFNPHERERDLEDTLQVLLDTGGPFGLCVNKLFVLPGTALAESVAREGTSVDERAAMFEHFSRLFWIASRSPVSNYIVRFIQRFHAFRRWPGLVTSLEPVISATVPAYRLYIKSRAAAAWILRRTVAKWFPGLIKFRRDELLGVSGTASEPR
jgi:anaerobic magnesium-protoporphyrin IX monomethyl ester cyclase